MNGKPQQLSPDTSGYFVLQRKWQDKDEVILQLSSTLYTEAMPDNPSRQAIFYGPVLLAGLLGEQEPDPVSGVPVFVTSRPDVSHWVQSTGNATATFHSSGTGIPGDVQLVPFYDTKKQYYSVYWDVFTPASWAAQQQIYEQRKKEARELETHTVDVLRPGEMQPERDHAFTGEKLHTEEEHGRKWRVAWPGGYFSFTMKVAPDGSNTLICSYWGMDNRGRVFDIQIDGVTIATEDLNRYKASKFYDIRYKIPRNLTNGKLSVTVKFAPRSQNSAGPLYGCRMIKD